MEENQDPVKKEKKLLERDIQRQICEWLQYKGFFFWRSNNIPVFGQSNDGKRRFRALPKFTPRGLPDIIVIIQGRFVALEVKRPGQKLRTEQGEFALKCITNDGLYFVVHSLDEAMLIDVFSNTPPAVKELQPKKIELN